MDMFHELMSVSVFEEKQVYLFHHGLRNRMCLHAIRDYLKSIGESIAEFEHFQSFVKEKMDEIRAFLIEANYPVIVFEKIWKWAFK